MADPVGFNYSIGAVFVGSTQADIFTIPAGLLDWENLEKGLVTGIEEVGPIRFFSVKGLGMILFHNLRAIALDSLLGIFSFGVLGIIALDPPFRHYRLFFGRGWAKPAFRPGYFCWVLYFPMGSWKFLQLSLQER